LLDDARLASVSESRRSAHPATRAEPRGIGSAGARDQLAREVKLLGSLLGQVIAEQAGMPALELVERVRRSTIALRRADAAAANRQRLAAELDALDLPDIEMLARAFSLYFQLTNLAEEKQRIRRLRQRQRTAPRKPLPESIAAAVAELRQQAGEQRALDEVVARLIVAPVLTAHPTEARRRTLLVALRRAYRLLDKLDDPRLTPADDADTRRRLREEISLLWHVSPVRTQTPTPLDEVRSAMAFFDESLYVVTPRLYRALERALGTDSGSRHQQAVPAFLRWGSWIGGDRDGNPQVTAAVTSEALRIQADHVLRAHEQVCRRLMQTVAAETQATPALANRLAADRLRLPEIAAELERRFPLASYRRRFGFMAERLRRTRLRVTGAIGDDQPAGGYDSADEPAAELAEVAQALTADGLVRVAEGEVQDFAWQLATFGFHGLALEIRQHSAVHAAALAAKSPRTAVAPGVSAAEVLYTFRAMAAAQARLGPAACHSYIVSFTRSAQDVLGVLELARRAVDGTRHHLQLDVVPLFESADALSGCGQILDELFAAPAYRQHLAARGMRQEVMLGYSDSTRESGALAAAWLLYRAQEQLVSLAARHGVELTIFHGRGGAMGRGGGPMTRAVTAQPPGSVAGRLKLTEQGEVVADRYANPGIALRHLEQLTHATLLASTRDQDAATQAAAEHAAVLDELASDARRAYRALVWDDPHFADFFHAATPVEEVAQLAIGSRPAARGRPGFATLRAIPWVFAWSQSRANLPGWYGTGTALAAYRAGHRRAGLTRLREMYQAWPFFASVLDNAEISLAKADMAVAERYAALARSPGAGRIWRQIRDDYERSVSEVLDVSGRARLLADAPVLARSIELRNPYVDSLSELQVRLLERLRQLPAGDRARAELLRLVHLTVSGVAAGLQNTG
jgi:phosphoenolpyruvate carboxylase